MDWPHLELVGEQHPLTLLEKSTESDNHLMLTYSVFIYSSSCINRPIFYQKNSEV